MNRINEVQDRLQRLTDNFSGYNLGYVYDELSELADIVWEMMDVIWETMGEESDEEAVESEAEES